MTAPPDLEDLKRAESSEGPYSPDPLRILCLDTQGVCQQLFSKQLCAHLSFGTISHPFILAATFGPERIHKKLDAREETKQIWEEQASIAPPRAANMTYGVATEKFLREADRLEQKVCGRSPSRCAFHVGKLMCVGQHSLCQRIRSLHHEA